MEEPYPKCPQVTPGRHARKVSRIFVFLTFFYFFFKVIYQVSIYSPYVAVTDAPGNGREGFACVCVQEREKGRGEFGRISEGDRARVREGEGRGEKGIRLEVEEEMGMDRER